MRNYIRQTPVFTSTDLDRITGAHVSLKIDNFQRSGSYKPRTAFNSTLCALERECIPAEGVVADSSGNYAQAIAFGGRDARRTDHGLRP
jgi:threonine dehydratase